MVGLVLLLCRCGMCGMWECRRGGGLMLESDGSMTVSSVTGGRCAGFKSDDIELNRFGRGLSGVEDVGWFSCASEKLRFLLGPEYGVSVRWSSGENSRANADDGS